MMKKKSKERAPPKVKKPKWHLKLYVAGATGKSAAAVMNLTRICEEHVIEDYEIEVIDLSKNPQLAKGDQIIAVPTLIKKVPAPVRKIIGDLSDTDKVLVGLNIIKRLG